MSSNGSNAVPFFRFEVLLFLLTQAVALFGAMHAVGWNDGSRLATVESLVDYHTWQIDQSIFTAHTGDKMFINGHYYSDKSPVPALAMAVVYQVFQWTTGLKAAQEPSLFVFLMALSFSGTAYVVSVLGLDRLMVRSSLSNKMRVPLVASFALGTIALTYSRVSNIHILMLAVFILLFLLLERAVEPGWEKFSQGQLLALGSLLGYRTRSLASVIIVLASAFPWFALHHVLNYRIGGTFLPANTVSQYFLFPGSTLTAQNLTGAGWAHHNLSEFLIYCVGLLFGNQGFIVHNLMLFFAIPAAVVGLRETVEKRGLIYYSIGLILGIGLLYAATSNNYSGECCSIRWFVPLLVPFYYVLILALKRYPSAVVDLWILSAWSIVLGVLLWGHGPLTPPLLPALWYVNAAALISWLGYRGFRFWTKPASPPQLS